MKRLNKPRINRDRYEPKYELLSLEGQIPASFTFHFRGPTYLLIMSPINSLIDGIRFIFESRNKV